MWILLVPNCISESNYASLFIFISSLMIDINCSTKNKELFLRSLLSIVSRIYSSLACALINTHFLSCHYVQKHLSATRWKRRYLHSITLIKVILLKYYILQKSILLWSCSTITYMLIWNSVNIFFSYWCNCTIKGCMC